MVFLILESLGSTELVFILVMALVFFGPRKLPQISRSIGKNLADFRRASEDFKRTWNKEVSLEELGSPGTSTNHFELSEQNSALDNEIAGESVPAPTIGSIAPERVIARHAPRSTTIHSSDQTDSASDQDFDGATDETKHSPKSDWF